jgi:hypothetical protein
MLTGPSLLTSSQSTLNVGPGLPSLVDFPIRPSIPTSMRTPSLSSSCGKQNSLRSTAPPNELEDVRSLLWTDILRLSQDHEAVCSTFVQETSPACSFRRFARHRRLVNTRRRRPPWDGLPLLRRRRRRRELAPCVRKSSGLSLHLLCSLKMR